MMPPDNAALQAKLDKAVKALEPFKRALEECGDEQEVSGTRDLYDHPLSMCIMIGDFRRASDTLKELTND